jgi:hypothetical protein
MFCFITMMMSIKDHKPRTETNPAKATNSNTSMENVEKGTKSISPGTSPHCYDCLNVQANREILMTGRSKNSMSGVVSYHGMAGQIKFARWLAPSMIQKGAKSKARLQGRDGATAVHRYPLEPRCSYEISRSRSTTRSSPWCRLRRSSWRECECECEWMRYSRSYSSW